jgi:hypothetical protein
MRKIYVIITLLLSLSHTFSYAQPAVMNINQDVSGTYTNTATTVIGGSFFQARFQENGVGAASGLRNWQFNSDGYSNVWGATSANTLAAYNTLIVPNTATASANWVVGGFNAFGKLLATQPNYYYTYNINKGNSYASQLMAVLETSFNPVAISTVTQSPLAANVAANNEVVLTITTASAPAIGENVFVRYTTNGYASSTLIQATFTGSTSTVTLPCQALGTNVSYYVFSSPETLAQINADVATNGQAVYDMATLNINNNGGPNYSYTVGNPAAPSVAISALPVGAICSGTSVTFTATPTNGGAVPTYQWQVNGTDVFGQTASTFTTTTLNNNDAVTVVMTSNSTVCLAGTASPPSNTITQTVNPNHTIILTSGSTTPTLCINTLLATDIVYTIGGGAASAGVTGLPAGMVGTLSGTTFTISGSPTASGSFPYTVTTTGNGCIVATATGTITVDPIHTISLTSGSNTPTLCINTLLGTNIVYTIGGGATSAGVTGLPAGMVGTFSGTTFTVSGTPTASGSFPYTVTTTGNGCTVATATGTITVDPIHTISLTSGSNTPTLCINTLLGTNIVYTIAGGATSAGVTGLPAGMVGTFSGTTFTISGTPTASGSFPYTVTTTGNGCTVANANGTITVNPIHTISLTSGSNTPTLCINTALNVSAANIVYTLGGGATNAGVTGLPAGVTGISSGTTYTISGTPTASGTFSYTITTTGNPCINATVTGTITVQAATIPAVSIVASPAGAILAGTSVTFTATPTNGGAAPSYQWLVGGLPAPGGTNSPTYTSTTLTNGQIVTVQMTSNATPCLINNPANSNSIGTVIGVVRITATTGNVGPIIYTTLKNAFDAVNAGTHTGIITIDILGNTTETAAAVLNASGGASSYTAVSIRPIGGVRTVTGAIGTALVDLNGADNVTIDGDITGTKSLTFSNTSTAATATIRLYTDATNNIIRNCTILSAEASTTGGAIVFGAGTNGNDINLITLNNIGPVATGGGTTVTYFNGIYSSGVATNFTDQVTISNNNIYDFFNPAAAGDAGINLAASNHRWTITGNSIYQTVSRAVTNGSTHIGIAIAATNADGYLISGNFIGGSAASAGGTAWTITSSAYRFVGMQLAFVSTTLFAVSSIQNNTITNFNIATTTNGSTYGIWCGIGIAGGNMNIGNATANIIGATSGTGSISVTTSTTGGLSYGIDAIAGAAGALNISNNTIGSIIMSTTAGTIAHGFIGINIPAVNNLSTTINNNTIGHATVANSINITGASGAATTGQPVAGIFSAQNNSAHTFSNNTIANITNAASSSGTTTFINVNKGILVGTTLTTAPAQVGSSYTITGNVIKNLSIASAYTGTNQTTPLSGITFLSSVAGNVISGNTIGALSNSASGLLQAIGIFVNVSGTTATVAKNTIYNIVPATGGATPEVRGISLSGGTIATSNNMINLGYKVDGTSLTVSTNIYGIYTFLGTQNCYFNTVLIGGTGVTTGGVTAAFNNQSGNPSAAQNNIFANTRSGGAINSHFCVIANPIGGLGAVDYNAYYGNGTGFAFGRVGTATNYAALCAWRTATSKDANTIFIDPLFNTASGVTPNLHLTAASPLEAKGIAAGGITDDIDGNPRSGTFDIGADEGAFTLTNFAVTATATSPSPICSNTNLVLTGAGTGPGGLTYGWTGPNGFTSALQSPTITAATTAATGTYILTVTDQLSGCVTATSNVAVTVTAQPSATVNYTGGVGFNYCSNAGTATPVLTGTTGGIFSETISTGLVFTNTATGAIDLAASTLGTHTVQYTVAAAGGCAIYTTNATITINQYPNTIISYPSSPYCATGTAFVNYTGQAPVGTPFSISGGLTINSNTGAIDLNGAAPGTYTVTYTKPAAGGCALYTTTANITIINTGSWTGAVSSDWNNGLNWACGNTIPTSTTNVTIPNGAPNYPLIGTGNASAANINIASAASVTVNGTGTFNLYGAITNAGSFDLTAGTLNMAGTAAQTLAGTSIATGTVKNLTISNSVTLSSEVKVTDNLLFGTTGNTLTTNDNLTLVSSPTNTAYLGNTTGNTITGKASIERYLFARKAWRFLATPIAAAGSPTIQESWMEGDAPGTFAAAAGYGTRITGPGAGMDEISQRGSLKTFDPVANAFAEVLNVGQLTNPIAEKKGYFVFVRGDRSISQPSGATGATTLRIKGNILTGQQTFTVPPAVIYNSFGNPYPAAINFITVQKDGTVSNSYYAWNPLFSANGAVGRYELFLYDGTHYTQVGGVGGAYRDYIQSGEAVFIQADAAGGDIRVNETDKVPNVGNILISREGVGEMGRAGVTKPTLEINLHTTDNNGANILADAAIINFDNSFTAGLDQKDVRKINNSFDNIAVKSNDKLLIVERRPTLVETDTIKINIANTRIANYRLIIDPSVLASTGLTGILKDKFLQTETIVSLIDSTTVPFATTADAASRAADRFMIVFKQTANPQFTTIAATRNADKTIKVNWGVQNERGINNYIIEQSNDGTNFTTLTTKAAIGNNGSNEAYTITDATASRNNNWYRVKANIVNGIGKYTAVAFVGALPADAIVTPMISVYPNPVIEDKTFHVKFANKAGKYTLVLVNGMGQQVYTELVTVATDYLVKNIVLQNGIAAGKYDLLIINENGNKEITSVIIK